MGSNLLWKRIMRRFSIRGLMAFVVISAVGLAALRNAGDLWAGMLLLFALASVGAAVMGAFILQGRDRYWWAGFAFFGGGYLALAVGPWLSDAFQPQLGTTHLLDQIQGRMHPAIDPTQGNLAAWLVERADVVAGLSNMKRLARNTNDPALVLAKKRIVLLEKMIAAVKRAPTHDQFQRIGHSLFALLAGVVGGLVASWFYMRRERGNMPEAAPTPFEN
jgi:hypothetical protein